jgi:predicted ATPase
MITRVELINFKRFKRQAFDLKGNIVLAGPNNSGKSTLIQAIATWNLALREWFAERADSKAQVRTGVQLPSSRFTAIPLREMKLLWNNTDTAKRKHELEPGEKLGTPRPLEIRVTGEYEGRVWTVGMAFQYRFKDLVLVKPTEDTNLEDIPWVNKRFSLLFVPSFSGIGINETRYDKPYQEMLIGQGKPGDLIRNRILEIFESKPDRWTQLVKDVQDIFGYTLLPPQYTGQPYIVCEYVPELIEGRAKSGDVVLDVASAGSGFLQVVLLLSFFYAQDSGLVLFDEPDAHLHIVLQRQVYDKVRGVASQTRSQLVIATHSEVVIDNTAPENVISFYREPHKLSHAEEAMKVRSALRRLTSMDILQADRWPYILYLEGKSDFNLLAEWARILDHPLARHFQEREKNLFWHNNIGRDPRSAKEHLFALRAVNPEMKGVLLLDGDGRLLSDHEIRADGLEIIRWKRYEAENYLLVPSVLQRFVGGDTSDLFSESKVSELNDFIRNSPFLRIEKVPFEDDEVQQSIGASKNFLPQLFEAIDLTISKPEYYTIARCMNADEIHPEVKEKLDFIYSVIG